MLVSNAFFYFQYCEYYPDYEKCKIWLEKNLPAEFSKVKIGGDAATDDASGTADDDKKRQKRGGKGMVKAKKTRDDGPRKVCVSRAARGKKKSVTVVTGLSTFGTIFLKFYEFSWFDQFGWLSPKCFPFIDSRNFSTQNCNF